MKTNKIIVAIFALSFIIITSCATSKNGSVVNLQNTLWELEFLSGSERELKTLFPVKYPSITLHESSKKAEGTDGCNGYSSDFTVSGNNLTFGEPGPATLMYCGEGESIYRSALEKVNRYAINSMNELMLMTDDIVLLRFKKSN